MLTNCEYISLPMAITMPAMQTIQETRRSRLNMLIKQYGSVPALRKKCEGKPFETQIRQIITKQVRTECETTYQMGEAVALGIETSLKLPVGWMDTPPTYKDLLGAEDPVSKVLTAMESMSPEIQRLIAALSDSMLQQPAF